MNRRITVLMPTFNRARYIEASIASAVPQLLENDELLIIDDGSSDGTEKKVAKYLNDNRIRYFSRNHQGAPAARNYALTRARNPWVLWLDSDDLLLPGVLDRYRDMLAATPGIDVLYGDMKLCGDIRAAESAEMVFTDYGRDRTRLLPDLLYRNQIPNPGTMVRKSLYRKHGDYNPAFARLHDYELWVRWAPHIRAQHCGRFVVKWRWHDSNMSSASVRRDMRYDSMIIDRLVELYDVAELFPAFNWCSAKRSAARAWIEIARKYRAVGDVAKACDGMVRAADLWPRPEVLVHLQELMVRLAAGGKKTYCRLVPETYQDRARAALATLRGRSYLAKYNLASLNQASGNLDAAQTRFLPLAKALRGKAAYREMLAGVKFHLGEIHLAQGNRRAAEKMFAACLSLLPQHGQARKQLAALAPQRRISIIIPYYQDERYLHACLASIEAATEYENYEIIVVDDCSPTPLPPRFKKRFRKVKFYRSRRNRGFTRTVNCGAAHARGDILLFLNMDTEVITPGWLQLLNHVFAGDAAIGVVGAKLLYPKSNTVQFAGGIIDPEGRKQLHMYKHAPADLPAVNHSRMVDFVTGAFLAIDRTLFERLAGFDQAYHSSLEDVDICFRVTAAGYKVWYESAIALYHAETVSGLSAVHHFASALLLEKKWGKRMNAARAHYYRDDGYSEKCIGTLLDLFLGDFSSIIRVFMDFKLATPPRQDDFIGRYSAAKLLNKLIAYYAARDREFRAVLSYYKMVAMLKSGGEMDLPAVARDCLDAGENGYRQDEARLLLFLHAPDICRFSRDEFALQRHYQIYKMMKQIAAGQYRFSGVHVTYEKNLLLRFLNFINTACTSIERSLLEKYATFIFNNVHLFSNVDALVALCFKMSRYADGAAAERLVARADRIIARHAWPPTYRARFAINKGSFYEQCARYRQAVRCFETARRNSSASNQALLTSIYYHLGVCNRALGRNALAEKYLRKCLALSPAHTAARACLRQG